MRVLMFGWEFPPYNSGGLGVACRGLIRGLACQGAEIVFVLPKKLDCVSDFCKIIFAGNFGEKRLFDVRCVNSLLRPYITSESYRVLASDPELFDSMMYSSDLFGEVLRYGKEACKIVQREKFDIIHVHDWLSIPAGLAAKRVSGKPLIVHIHATEFDRTGGHSVNQEVYEIENEGMREADAVIAVSNFTKELIVRHYGIDPGKIHVVHNAVDHGEFYPQTRDSTVVLGALKEKNKKVVLFVGRITLQKGVEYFIRAAKKVLERESDVLFVIAGSGDMEGQIIEETVELGIADKVLFAGFLRDDDLLRIYRAANLCVFPSVSEPFGITPLEALACKTPVLISKQSGVSELVSHALKADFWDVDELANKILSVLKYPELYGALKDNGYQQVKAINWANSARKCLEIYRKVLKPCGARLEH